MAAPIRPVQKSPSLTVAESWLSTVVSSGHADRIQNHVFSDTAGTWDSTGKAIYSVACASSATALGRNAQWMARK